MKAIVILLLGYMLGVASTITFLIAATAIASMKPKRQPTKEEWRMR